MFLGYTDISLLHETKCLAGKRKVCIAACAEVVTGGGDK